MMGNFRESKYSSQNERGSTMLETALTIALMALVIVASVVYFGDEIRSTFWKAGVSIMNEEIHSVGGSWGGDASGV